MSLNLRAISIPKTSRTVASKYNFGALVVGGPALVEDEVVNAKKAQSRMASALVAYRARTGDTSKFIVRIVKDEATGVESVAVWKTADAVAPAAQA